jgi:hypothetical protein
LDWKPCAHFNALVSYAPDVVFYHSEPSEDHVAHRGLFNFGGTVADITWDAVNTLTWVDGSDEGLYFGGPGGAPAIGGIPIRERRDQFVYRSALKATWSICERLFVRPVITGYCHDFQTVQKNNALGQPDYGYENYVDRSELTTGLDLGWQIQPQTRVFVGYRYGKEVEGRVVGSPYHYDSTFHRPLAGIEGQPAKWIKLAVAVGPDIHHTTGQPAPGFDVDYTTVWSDTVVTLLPTEKDSLVLTWKANTQPAFASPSVYDDITYDATAKHRFDKHWTVGAGFRTYIGDWMSPVDRDDWIYTVSTGVAYTHNKHLGADLTYSYDWVDSKVSNTEGREFTRHLVSLALKYTF